MLPVSGVRGKKGADELDFLFTFLQIAQNVLIEIRVNGDPNALEEQILAVDELLQEMLDARQTVFSNYLTGHPRIDGLIDFYGNTMIHPTQGVQDQ